MAAPRKISPRYGRLSPVITRRLFFPLSVRPALYMATLVATRRNPVIRAFYRRLRGVGKEPQVAIIAAMKKLLTILNAMVKHQATWSPVTTAV